MIGTLPARTQGLGLITEPLMRDIGIGRVAYAQINLVATLVGALGCVGVGRLIDRRGSRIVLTTVAFALGVVVVAMSRVTGVLAILILVTLTPRSRTERASIVSLAMVGKWFCWRLTRAMAVYALAMSIGFMVAFPLVGQMVLASGWRMAWAVVRREPHLWCWRRSRGSLTVHLPEAIGLEIDGGGMQAEQPAADAVDGTSPRRCCISAFWVVASASSAYGLLASGIGLFNESILAERGFTPDVYYTALAVTAITGLTGNFAAGAFADRGSLRRVLMAALAILSVGLVALAHVTTWAQVMVQAVAMGIGGGFVMVVFFSFWGAVGPAHLGRIQGAAQAMTVLASAIGPLLLALCVDATGSYSAAFYSLAAVVAALGIGAAIVPMPAGAERQPVRLG
jgi:MFS family permease